MSEPWIDRAHAAQHMGWTERFVNRLCDEGRVAYAVIGGKRMFRISDLDAYAEALVRQPVTGPLAERAS